jgi:hypothetical protein
MEKYLKSESKLEQRKEKIAELKLSELKAQAPD